MIIFKQKTRKTSREDDQDDDESSHLLMHFLEPSFLLQMGTLSLRHGLTIGPIIQAFFAILYLHGIMGP